MIKIQVTSIGNKGYYEVLFGDLQVIHTFKWDGIAMKPAMKHNQRCLVDTRCHLVEERVSNNKVRGYVRGRRGHSV